MLEQLLSVFLHSRCVFCDRLTSQEDNSTTIDALCEFCSQKLSSHQLPKSDRLRLYRQSNTFAWGRYDGQLKRAIALMKYQNQPVIGSLLGELLGQAWLENTAIKHPAKLSVIPIPLHRHKQQQRGFNQAQVIAKSFCQITGFKLHTKALIRTRETEAMFNLSTLKARAKNLQGALKVGDKLPKYPVLLVDDIHTTGTTVNEAIKVLQQQNIRVFSVVVAAKAGV